MAGSSAWKLAALVALGLGGGATAADEEGVPMRPFGTQPAIEVRVNGKASYLFLVDTGAGGHARIDRSVVEALKVSRTGTATASGATA